MLLAIIRIVDWLGRRRSWFEWIWRRVGGILIPGIVLERLVRANIKSLEKATYIWKIRHGGKLVGGGLFQILGLLVSTVDSE